MNMSPDGYAQLMKREGSVATMYLDSAGLPTIGVGHLLTKDELTSGKITALGVDWREGLTQPQIAELLAQDAGFATRTVSTAVTVPLTQHQFDALVSFTFNVGSSAFWHSTLLKWLNGTEPKGPDYGSVPGQLKRWVYSLKGAVMEVNPILVERRHSESQQWEGLTAK